MKNKGIKGSVSRRDFFRLVTLGGVGTVVLPGLVNNNLTASQNFERFQKPDTNISDALKYPRNDNSMPGKYPGKVIRVEHSKCITDNKIDYEIVNQMIEKSISALTGESNTDKAWLKFVSPKDRIGLKVNPVAGKQLSTSLEITRAVMAQLMKAGIPKENIIIWDRRAMDLADTGFNDENFPGFRILGTEHKGEDGSFYNSEGKLLSEGMIDKDWFYYADCEEKYDAETLPYMVNEGKYSYFTNICTQQVDKIINLPILKNAGSSVTLCLKNLAYGSITNTGRLHKDLWSETCAEVCAFPPLRDKVVLNIVDGIKGCYQGGPGASPEYITSFNCLLMGTDPVAVDRVGYEIILKKRIDEGIQKQETAKGREFLNLAQKYGLGIADLEKISLEKITLA
ncbi:MAG: DUF362 domain-containing protein [Bacteroidia bacterium]|nr:DUF362 domain-containing protein [Bacteroidia bacterium]